VTIDADTRDEEWMDEAEWAKFMAHLDSAESSLRAAFLLMDGIEGFTEPAEHAMSAAHAAIDAVRSAEVAHRESRIRTEAREMRRVLKEIASYYNPAVDQSSGSQAAAKLARETLERLDLLYEASPESG